jgi:hypothetical protein
MAAKKLPVKAKAKTGRPTDYNEEIAAIICERVATHSLGLNKICAKYDDLPVPSTIYLWRLKHPTFSVKYAQAKMIQSDILAEECLSIADDDSQDTKINMLTGEEVCNTEFIARSRLRIDTRKWLAAKLLPKQYGPVIAEDKKTVSESIVEKLIDRLID